MAINPIRVNPLDIPTYLPSAARAPEGTFNNIASIGDAIGQYRERNKLAEVAKGAIGPDGQLDINKFATGAALAGIDPMRALTIAEAARGRTTSENAQRALEAYHNATLKETARANTESERLRQEQINQGREFTIDDPLGVGPQRRFRTTPGGVEQIYPPPPKVPGPQSSLEPPPPNMAAAEPPAATAAVEPGPENAPPYQVAGPPMPPPQAPAGVVAPPAAAQPAATPDREAALQGFAQQNGPEAAAIFRDILDYKRGLPTDDKLRQRWITAARTLDKNFDPNKFEQDKKRPTVSAEMEARIGMGGKFLSDLEDVTDSQGNVIPGIRSRVASGEMNKDYSTATQAMLGKGGPGEVRRLIDGGAEALIRMLTGAGMNKEEVATYERRYQFRYRENPTETLSKLDDLAGVLKSVQHAVETGKASPEELRKVLGERKPSALAPKAPARAQNETEINTQVGMAQKQYDKVTSPEHKAEVIRRLQERLPEGMDARRLLNR